MAKLNLQLIRKGEKERLNWYWFGPHLLTLKGNWRKSPDGVYFDPLKGKGKIYEQ